MSDVKTLREKRGWGFFLGIGGVLTFKNARKLVETVEYAPLDRLVLETDCPYLSPVPNRGKAGGGSKKCYLLCRKLSLDCDCVWLAFFRCGLMGFLFLQHLCGGNDGADGGGTVLSYLSDWEKPKIKLK